MQNDYVSVWDRCLQMIRENVNDQSFRTWFEPIKPVRLEESALTIQVPNKFFYEWLEEHYIDILKKAVRRELGTKARLEYQIHLAHHKERKAGAGAANTDARGAQPVSESVRKLAATEIANPFVIPGIKRDVIDSQLNTKYRFDNYIEGDCNRLARSAGEAVAGRPGRTSFNPLFLYGSVGLGKTHLAQAIGNAIELSGAHETVRYMTTEKFTNDIIFAIKNNVVGDLVALYQNIDVLIVDDIQFLANRQKTQEIFFHIFNQLHQNASQIILTSDRPPKDLPGIEERLVSRFKWGLSADLQAPDFETRIAIFECKLADVGLEVPRDIVEYICYNIKNNIRELEGVATSLIAHSSLASRDVDMQLAQEVIQNFISNVSHEVTVDKIVRLVSRYYDVPVERLRSKSRKREIVIARQTAIYLSKIMTGESLKNIGEEFGGRDHSTVIYSVRAVQDQMDTDPNYKEVIGDLEKEISMSMAE